MNFPLTTSVTVFHFLLFYGNTIVLVCIPFFDQSCLNTSLKLGFPGGSDGKESTCNAGDCDSTPGLGRSPGEGNGYPLQCSCLENPIDRGA